MPRYITVLLVLFFFVHTVSAISAETYTVNIADFGAVPNDKSGCTAAVEKALDSCKGRNNTDGNAVLVFPKGRYDFYPLAERGSGTGIIIEGQKNLTINGQGSEFIFHGIMSICSIIKSENIKVENFTVDWERPYIVQGTIADTADNYVDIKFDTKEYPFEITDGKLFFLCEYDKRQVAGYTLLFDKKTKELVYKTRDDALGGSDLFNNKAELLNKSLKLNESTVRFYGKTRMKPEPGTYIALWLGRYMRVAFNLDHSKDIQLENIDLYHGLSHGIAGFKTENITIRNVNYKTNEKKDRVFSLIADGIHLNTCKGLVKIENCSQEGMGDDFLNLHGMNVMVQKRLDDYTVEVGVTGKTGASYVLESGDEVWFVNGGTVQRSGSGKIKEIKEIKDGGKTVAKHIIFEEKIPAELKEKDALENKTWNAELEVRNCKILKKHRARGLLITTPLRAVVENNYFRTAGTAILIEGDVNYWYESGGVNDLLIRNNVFEDCFSSGFSGDWGHAAITIHPSFQPKSVDDEAYHRNIRIENNMFKVFDYPVLYARSVRDLTFTGNKLERSDTYQPFAVNKASFSLNGCRNTLIDANQWGEDVLGKNVETLNMKPDDLILKDKNVRREE